MADAAQGISVQVGRGSLGLLGAGAGQEVGGVAIDRMLLLRQELGQGCVQVQDKGGADASRARNARS